MEALNESERKRQAVEKVLGEPIFLEYSEPVLKARRNLLVVGTISIAFWTWDLRIARDPTVLGVQVQNLSASVVAWGLLWILCYLVAHFIWQSWDAFQEWRVRLTGCKVVHTTVARLASEDGDYPSDPRQSTLYGWWKERTLHAKQATEVADALRNAASQWKEVLKDQQAIPFLSNVADNLSRLTAATKEMTGIPNADRIPASLQRFDEAYLRLLRSENLRWVLLEFGTPVVIGIGGVIAATAMIVATQTPPVTTASPVSLIASSPPAPAQQASRPSAR